MSWQTILFFSVLILGGGAGLMIFWQQRIAYYQKQYETAELLRKTQEQYQGLIEHASDGVFIADANGKYLEANPSGCAMLGYTRDEILSKRISDLVAPEDIAATPLRLDELRQGKTVLLERRLIRKNGSLLPVEISASMAPDGRFQSIIRDITERKQAEKEIQQLSRFPHENPNPVLRIAQNGKILYANQSSEPILTAWDRNMGQNIPEEWRAQIASVLESGETKEAELNWQEKIFSCAMTPVLDEGYVNIYGRDITDRKQAEEELKESERKLRELNSDLKQAQSIAHLGNWKWDLKTSTVEWSDEMFNIFGIDKDSYSGRLGDVIAKVIHPDDLHIVLPENAAKFAGNKPQEYRIIWPDGSTHHIWAKAGESILDEQGNPAYLTGIAQDITERKQSEEKLTASEVRYRRLFETAKDGILILDADTGMVVDVNPFLVKMLGFSHETFLGKAIWDLGFFKDVVANQENFVEFQQKEYIRYEDLPLKTSQGKLINVEFVSNVYPVNHHKVIQCNIRDITERKLAEEVLAQEKVFIEALLESVPGYLYVYDDQGNLIRWNKKHETMTGYSAEELSHMNMSKWFEGDDAIRVAAAVEEVMTTGYGEVEANLLIKGGGKLLIHSNGVRLNLNGKTYFTGVGIDITERKQAEKALEESEARWRRAIADSPIPIMIHDEDDRVLQLSSGWTKFSGYDIDDIPTLADWTERAYGERTGFKKDYIDQLFLINQTVQNGEWEVTAKDGSKRIWDFQTTPLGQGGQGRRVIHSMALDITERKQAEELLRENEARLHLALKAAKAGTWEWDLQTNKNIWSEELWKIYGLEPHGSEPLYDTWLAIIHPDDREMSAQTVIEAAKNETELNTEWRVIDKDGTQRWLMSRGQPLKNSAGQVVRFIGTVLDITERKQAEKKLAQYSEHLEEMVEQRTRELRDTQEKLVRQERLATLGQLAGSVGHELRNPLGVISNAIYFLKLTQPNASDKVKEYLDIIEKETHTSDKIVTDLLDFTRIKSMDRQPVSVSELLRQTRERYAIPPAISVAFEIPADLPQIYVDPQHIIQVLINLISNACQSMIPTGSGTGALNLGKLTISAAAQSAMIKIAVQDTGAGIIPENMQKIFEPLYTTKIKGIGLGLAVSRKLTEANGGRIEVESGAGKGSTFTVYLPVYEVV